MKALAGVAAVAILFLVAAFSFSSADQAEFDQEQVEAEVLKVADNLMAAWNAENWEAHLSLFDTETLNVLWGPTVLDTHESFGEFMGFVEGYPSWDGEWDDTFVRVLGPNSALFRGRYHVTLTDLEGVKTFWEPHWTALLERRADGWKMTLVDHAYGTAEPVEGN